jgi:hypothetical protein
MKTVMVKGYKKQTDGRFKLEEKGQALFHDFGLGNAIGEASNILISTAIIEWPDGTLENVPVNHVRFLVPNENNN